MTRVNLGDRKLILGRVDGQRLYLLMSELRQNMRRGLRQPWPGGDHGERPGQA